MICEDPWHGANSISSKVYRHCPTCKLGARRERIDKAAELERTKAALAIARQWIEDPGVQAQIDLALFGKF